MCVPVKPETNGNVCEPKIYIEKNKNVLKLQEDTECGIVEEAGEDADEPSDTGRQYYAGYASPSVLLTLIATSLSM